MNKKQIQSAAWDLLDVMEGTGYYNLFRKQLDALRLALSNTRLLQEVMPMDIQSDTAKLILQYVNSINAQETPKTDSWFTPTELDAKRTSLHNTLLRELQAAGITFRDRQEVTEWALKFARWWRDD